MVHVSLIFLYLGSIEDERILNLAGLPFLCFFRPNVKNVKKTTEGKQLTVHHRACKCLLYLLLYKQ